MLYEDGHGYCFACKHHQKSTDSMSSTEDRGVRLPQDNNRLFEGKIPEQGLPHRGLTQETCEKFDYRIAKYAGEYVEVACYYGKEGNVIGQKVRSTNKKFTCRGNMSHAPLFGQNLWKGGGKKIVVTEGELDAMSIYEVTNGRLPVVSLPAGCAGAEIAIKDNLEFLNGYEQIILCFDTDEPGTKAATESAVCLPAGKAFIVTLPKKDANEMLTNGLTQQLIACLNEAAQYRPDGVVHVSEVDMSKEKDVPIYEYPFEKMSAKLWGRRAGEVIIHTSGSGMGKTTMLRSLMNHDLKTDRKIGVLMLEESTQDTVHQLLGLRLGKPIHKIMAMRKINGLRERAGKKALDFGIKDDMSDKEYNDAMASVKAEPFYLYNHFGSLECETLIRKMEYMHTSLGCEIIYLDHISIVVSGLESNNERKDIDVLMTKLRSFAERSGVRIEAVCHLTKPQGMGYEEGAQIGLNDLRGSGALAQLSDSVLGYERNQQHSDKSIANTIMVRSLKDRFSGYTGLVTALRYDQSTGRLNEVDFQMDGDVPVFGFSSGNPDQDIEDEAEDDGPLV